MSLLRDPDTSLLDSTQAEDKDKRTLSSDTFYSCSSSYEQKTLPIDDKSPLRHKSPQGHFDPYDSSEVWPKCLILSKIQLKKKTVILW